jgi:benzoylformate decarboxylase
MRQLVKELMNANLSRRGFLTGMVAAGYSVTAAKSALQSVAPFASGAAVPAELTRSFTGTGGELLAEQLIEAGCRYMFVSNGSGLGPLCDALVARPQIQLIQATHEGQVVAIADGYAKATGKIGFAMYSRVGLPHSSANMYNAMKDRTPVVTLSDHQNSDSEGRDSHEDLDDWLANIRGYSKWAWVVHDPERIPEWVRQACKVSSVLPCGPTHVRIPRNLMYQENVRGTIFSGSAFNIPMELRPNTKEIERAARMLLESSSPVMMVGPQVTQTHARKALVELAELLAMPVAQFRSYYADFPNFHPLYVQNYSRNGIYPKQVDLLVNFGARTYGGGDRGPKVIHANVDPVAIGQNTALSVALLGDLNHVARSLIDAVKSMATPARLAQLTETRRKECTAYTTRLHQAVMAAGQRSSGAPVPWQRLMWELNDLLDPDAIIVEEVGSEEKILNFFPFDDDKKMKIGRTEGRSLGWGAGASAGIKLAMPNRQVVAIHGDGGFLFGQTDSLWTMSRYNIPVMTVILNNRGYEEPRWNMMGAGGAAGRAGRDYVSYLGNPDVDFTKLAAAHNIPGVQVRSTDELRPAIERGIRTLRDGRPFMLDVVTKRIGVGAEVSWYPQYSVADLRDRKV